MLMIDIETMGSPPDGAIVAIGAVQFDRINGITKEFYCNIDLESNIKTGRKIDAKTVVWWLQQSKEAHQALFTEPQEELRDALVGLSKFILAEKVAVEPHPIWANGVTFDLVILRNAYESLEIKCPWSFRDEMCLRPIRFLGGLSGFDYSDFIQGMSGVKHNALDDAKIQAEYLLKYMQYSN